MVLPARSQKGGKRKAAEDDGTSSFPKTSSELVGEISSLKRRPRRDEALGILHKVASLVKPVMKNHGFKVKHLIEMFPKDPRLLGLNVNHGSKICLRLRPHYDDKTFLPLEDVIGTMLHELTHNKFGPHDQKFYAFLDKLKADYTDLMVSGYTGEGFMGKGNMLGRGAGTNLPLAQAREKALQAIEKRGVLAKGSGQKLGGVKPDKPLNVLVREAAERRAIDNKWCKNPEDYGRDELEMADSDIEEIRVVKRGSSPSTAGSSSGSSSGSSPKVVIIDDDDIKPNPIPTPVQSVSAHFIDLTEDD